MNAPYDDPLSMFDPPTAPGEDGEPTQEPTQLASQPPPDNPPVVDDHLWGFLQPCVPHPALLRLEFWRVSPQARIGRQKKDMDFTLSGYKVSNYHCMIQWDGADNDRGITVHDYSSNGTFINRQRIGKGKSRLLRDGNEIGFGLCELPTNKEDAEFDYRYIYRHCATSDAKDGLYKYYDLGAALGSGSFATVWKAMSRKTGMWYAVKMIKSKHGRGKASGSGIDAAIENARKTYGREINIMKRLKHANICELKEVFWQGADIDLVLELVEGGDLLEYILVRAGLTELQTIDISYQLCDALAYCHREGVTHRDLKPENVLLTRDEPPRVKVADFGLAKVVDSVTRLRTMCGTPNYLAPEVVLQRDASEGYDELVDSWSVGVMIFSMLTNATPFIEDENDAELRTRIANRQVAWHFVPDNISAPCVHFMRRLLEHNPRKRMGLRHSLSHQWLMNHTPAHNTSSWVPQHAHEEVTTPSTARDDAMNATAHGPAGDDATEMDQIMHRLHLDPNNMNHGPDTPPPDDDDQAPRIPGAYASQTLGAGGSTLPLKRRSEMQKEARAAGRPLAEPTAEMYARAAGDSMARAGGPSTHANGNKRAHSELTPLSEEEAAEVTVAPVRQSPRKRGRPAANANTPDGKTVKPKPKARGKAAKASAEAEAGPVRRSTRANAAARTAGKR